jgi:hypothetical protein
MRAALNNPIVDDSSKTPADITPCRHIDNANGVVNNAEEEQCQRNSDHDSNVSIYWDSSEAAKLFGFSYKNGDNMYERLKDRIRLLSEVQRSEDGYKRFVSDIEKKQLTTKQIFLFRKKCLYLRTAYVIALEKLGHNKNTWVNTCCNEAVEMLAYLGLEYTFDPLRASEWNRLFRRYGKFCYPNNYVANGIQQPKRSFPSGSSHGK